MNEINRSLFSGCVEYEELCGEIIVGDKLSDEAIKILGTLSEAEATCNKIPKTITNTENLSENESDSRSSSSDLFSEAVTTWNQMTQSLPSLLSDVISRLKSSKLSQPKILTGTVLVLLEVKVEIEIHVAIKVLL